MLCLAGLLVTAAALPSCADQLKEPPELLPIGAQTVQANETLRLQLEVSNPEGLALTYSFVGPDLPGLDGVTQIAGTPAGGIFTWTPLISHVGAHEFVFTASSSQGSGSQTTVITVTAPSDAAPIFLRPGAGGTFDLSRDPCVRFDIEVRDDDSQDVQIYHTGALPEGASISDAGPKRARFEWCPLPDQIEASERWTITLEADDGEHVPTRHTYVIVLRTPPKDEGCPGLPPEIAILSPQKGEVVRSRTGYDVTARVVDDMGLRDVPLLYYTTTEPEDSENPDLTQFNQTAFALQGEDWRGRIPDMGLGPEEQRTVYVMASATDNDDPQGTSCDHRVDSELLSFIAAGVPEEEPPPSLERCEPCDESEICSSGICALGANGGRCLDTCGSEGGCAVGTCTAVTRTEGASTSACGTVAVVCDGQVENPDTCTNDELEPSDSIPVAPPFGAGPVAGTICPDDEDFYRIDVEASTEVVVTLGGFVHNDGDLDLHLLDRFGTILDVSAGTADSEMVEHVFVEAQPVYAKVFGYEGDSNTYTLTVQTTPVVLCEEDGYEPNDALSNPTPVEIGELIEGVICPDNDDYYGFTVDEPSALSITTVFEAALYDLDIELYNPVGTKIAESQSSDSEESIEIEVPGDGLYVLRVLGFMGASGEYLAEIAVEPVTTCGGDGECPPGHVCYADGCQEASCAGIEDCPTDSYLCPLANPEPSVALCAGPCELNADCRSFEACKRFVEGRGCGSTGSGQNGDPCTSYGQCGGQRTCMSYTGGYCARANCASATDCETGTHCVADGDIWVCLLDCLESDDICRQAEGYTCELVSTIEEVIEFACVPPM